MDTTSPAFPPEFEQDILRLNLPPGISMDLDCGLQKIYKKMRQECVDLLVSAADILSDVEKQELIKIAESLKY